MDSQKIPETIGQAVGYDAQQVVYKGRGEAPSGKSGRHGHPSA